MPDPNAPECDCRALDMLVKEQGSPVVFDPKLNEYRIHIRDGYEFSMYHCFFCAGRLPKSRRDELFLHVTNDEIIRLKTILKDIKTLPDLLAAFGPPDRDDPMGSSESKRADDGGDRTTCHRTLTYCRLSPTAEVHATLHLDDRVLFSFWPKRIEEEKS
jgi:hypothetical protein